ncbi:LUD domain-containing protein [Bacteroides xylanisolvens]|nr:LUD domain-containing protein [Bacteroides xylanisolvens]
MTPTANWTDRNISSERSSLGPSKTADIEQALVMGAHGARDVLVILT